MADTHPYTTSRGGFVQVMSQFRQSFPAAVDAGTLKKLGFAPNNESYILNVLRFLGLLDDEGKKTAEAARVFNLHDDAEFHKAFAAAVKAAYKDLFELHQDAAWNLDADALIAFFRANDGTSAIVGRRQASTFQLLAAFSGYGDVPALKRSGDKSGKRAPAKKASSNDSGTPGGKRKKPPVTPRGEPTTVGLTVRIEVNLPADGDQATYDRIFKSIKENLLNG